MDSLDGTYTSNFLPSKPSMLLWGTYDHEWSLTAPETAAETAKAHVDYHLQRGVSLSRLWLDAHCAMDTKRMDDPHQQYLTEVCKLTSRMLIAEFEASPLKDIAFPDISTGAIFGPKPRTDDDEVPKFNPNATVFTPTATPEKAKPKAATSSAQVFAERCQKLGLRVSSAPAKSSSTLNASAVSFSPTSFEERCKKHGLRISSRQN